MTSSKYGEEVPGSPLPARAFRPNPDMCIAPVLSGKGFGAKREGWEQRMIRGMVEESDIQRMNDVHFNSWKMH